jgi:GrpB-like predicted nucleotidyltransferase (UPF0157 family)
MRHNLYVCLEGIASLENHLRLRDRLLRDAAARNAYSTLKQELAERCGDDIDAYVAGKTEFIASILREEGMSDDVVDDIRRANL